MTDHRQQPSPADREQQGLAINNSSLPDHAPLRDHRRLPFPSSCGQASDPAASRLDPTQLPKQEWSPWP
jgi:hypothetical protein